MTILALADPFEAGPTRKRAQPIAGAAAADRAARRATVAKVFGTATAPGGVSARFGTFTGAPSGWRDDRGRGGDRIAGAGGSRPGPIAPAAPGRPGLIHPADAETADAFGLRLAGAAARWQG